MNRENLVIDTIEEFLSVYIFEKIIIILVFFFFIFDNVTFNKITRVANMEQGPSSQGYGFSSGHVWM